MSLFLIPKTENMKLLKYVFALFILPGMISCKKQAPEDPTFDVQTAQQEYKVGDSVLFSISGYADNISFYSGEAGKEYRYKDRIESTDSKLNLNISTQVLYGAQNNNLHLMYSTDFCNLYTPDGIKAATWTDITNRFTLSTAAAGAVGAVASTGDIDISDLPVSGKPIYFAWKYTNEASVSAAVGARTWRIPVFNLSNKTPSGSLASIASVTTAGWLAVDVENPVNKWTIQSTTPFLFFTPASTLLPSEDWAITRALFPNAVTPDVGTGIKDYLKKMNNYKYAYKSPGTYTITFVAKNVNNKGLKEVVKELTINIKP
jgi:hypothetical protein